MRSLSSVLSLFFSLNNIPRETERSQNALLNTIEHWPLPTTGTTIRTTFTGTGSTGKYRFKCRMLWLTTSKCPFVRKVFHYLCSAVDTYMAIRPQRCRDGNPTPEWMRLKYGCAINNSISDICSVFALLVPLEMLPFNFSNSYPVPSDFLSIYTSQHVNVDFDGFYDHTLSAHPHVGTVELFHPPRKDTTDICAASGGAG